MQQEVSGKVFQKLDLLMYLHQESYWLFLWKKHNHLISKGYMSASRCLAE